jgi:hypothetical protein
LRGGVNSQSRDFHLADVISAYTGVLASPRGMEGIYDILDFLTGDSLVRHHLPTAADFCKPFIEKQFPDIAKIDGGSLSKQVKMAKGSGKEDQAFKTWLNNQVQAYGETVSIRPLTPEEKTGFGAYMVDNSLLLGALKKKEETQASLPAPEQKL